MTPFSWFLLGFLAFPGSLTVLVGIGYVVVRLFLRVKPKQSAGHSNVQAGLQ